jgi:hypothetical protein
LLSADRDHDGVSDGRELVAGTCPTDNQSVFRITALTRMTSSSLLVQWTSASNRFYILQRGTNLLNSASFTNLQVDLAARPPANTCTDSPPAGAAFFYRVGVHQ